MKVRLQEVSYTEIEAVPHKEPYRTYYKAYAAGRYRGNMLHDENPTDPDFSGSGWYVEIRPRHWYGHKEFVDAVKHLLRIKRVKR